MPPTIADVAKMTGFSKATISNVLTGKKAVSPDTTLKINDAFRSLNYRPSVIAKSLRTKKTHTIGVILPLSWGDSHVADIVQGIRRFFHTDDYYLILGSTKDSQEDELYHIDRMYSHNVDGLIIIPNNSENDYLASVLGTGVPTVFMDRKAKGEYGDCVMSDNFGGSYDAVSALIQKGHTKIGMITSTLKATTIIDRTRGYRSALEDAGLIMDESRVLYCDPWQGDGGAQTRWNMVGTGDMTALFIAYGTYVESILSYINENAIRIPQDLAVIAFDDFLHYTLMRPSLSAVKQPMLEMGLKAAQLILDRIANPDKPFETCYLSTKLILRESV